MFNALDTNCFLLSLNGRWLFMFYAFIVSAQEGLRRCHVYDEIDISQYEPIGQTWLGSLPRRGSDYKLALAAS